MHYLKALWIGLALSAQAMAGNDCIYRLVESRIDVDAESRLLQRMRVRVEVVNQAGIEEAAAIVNGYNGALQTASIDRVEVHKPDGRVLPVDTASRVSDQPVPVNPSAPIFSTSRVQSLIVPGVEKGDTVEYVTTLRERAPLYPGQFSVQFHYPPVRKFDQVDVTLSVPKDMPLQIDVRAVEKVSDTVVDGRRVLVFHHANGWGDLVPETERHLAWSDVAPSVAVTNLPDWKAAADAEWRRIEPKMTVTPAIRQLADSVTRGVTDRREQARRLYEWVNRNIRYIGTYDAYGGVVPNEADAVLARRYGDCKDHATLFGTLLRARGIEASPVLINWGDHYRMRSVPVGNFNHEISWIPEFGLFADTTAEMTAFGSLPDGQGDKDVLIIRTGTVARTPVSDGRVHVRKSESTLVFDRAGHGSLSTESRLQGRFASDARFLIRSKEDEAVLRNVQRNLQLDDLPVVSGEESDEEAGMYRFSLRGHLPQWLALPGPGGVPTALPGGEGVREFAEAVLANQKNHYPAPCSGGHLEDVLHLVLPDGVRVLALPRALTVENGPLRYAATYVQNGNRIDVRRVLEVNPASNVCSPQTYAAWLPVAKAIRRDSKSLILYE